MKMKKFLSLAMTAVLSASMLAGCGGNTGSGSGTGSTPGGTGSSDPGTGSNR